MKHLLPSGLFLVLAGVLALTPFAQAQRGGGADRGDWNQRIQERIMGAIQQTLEAPDDEWEILQPMVSKIYALQNEMRPSRMSLFAGRGRGGTEGRGRGGDAEGRGRGRGQFGERDGEREGNREGNREGRGRNQGDAASTALREAIESGDAAQIKKALTDLRDQREKQADELKKTQDELRQIVTLKQEATLVVHGFLD